MRYHYRLAEFKKNKSEQYNTFPLVTIKNQATLALILLIHRLRLQYIEGLNLLKIVFSLKYPYVWQRS